MIVVAVYHCFGFSMVECFNNSDSASMTWAHKIWSDLIVENLKHENKWELFSIIIFLAC